MPARELRLGAVLLLARLRRGRERSASRLPEGSGGKGALRRKGGVQDLALFRHSEDGSRRAPAKVPAQAEARRIRRECRARGEPGRNGLPFGSKRAVPARARRSAGATGRGLTTRLLSRPQSVGSRRSDVRLSRLGAHALRAREETASPTVEGIGGLR